MNSKLGTFVTTVLMLVVVLLWSVTVLADEPQLPADSETPHLEARVQAENAHREAANAAISRMRDSNRLDLDIELVGRTSVQIAGD